MQDMGGMQLAGRPGVYVLAGTRPHYLYKGAARDVAERVGHHMAGRVARTRTMRPLRLVYLEYCADYSAALRRETFLKSGAGREWLKEQLGARVAKWQTQGTSRLRRVRLWRKNPFPGVGK